MNLVQEQIDPNYNLEVSIDTLARTIWGEAREHDLDFKKGVACVIMNRLQHSEENGGYWWGNSISQVCQKPYQYQCWNRSSVTYQNLVSISKDDFTFKFCHDLAIQAVQGKLPDITKGSTHYHHTLEMPFWAKRERPRVILGSHKFYRIV